jgi:superfamily II DNA or RNA helicase
MDQNTAYISNYLFLPRKFVSVAPIRYSLAIGDMPSDSLLTDTHIRVPRHFLDVKNTEVPYSVEEITHNAESIDVEAKTSLRPGQINALQAMIDNKNGILNLGCGHGKTVVSLHYLAHTKTKTIIVVNRANLIDQWREEIDKHLDIKPKKIGIVQGKKFEWEDKDIVLATIQTLVKRIDGNDEFFKSFGLVIFDECHHLSAPVFKQICPLFHGLRHGLSATPKREDGYQNAFIYHLGPVYYSDISQEIVPKSYFVKTDIKDDDVADEAYDVAGEIHHRKLCAWLGSLQNRNEIIFNIIDRLLNNGHKILCLSHSVEHVQEMHKLRLDSGIACGDVDPEKRREEIENNPLSFGTIDVAAEALNVPSLSALIVMTPFGAKTQGNILQQSLGRIQRRCLGKNDAIAIFIEDDIGMCSSLTRQIKKRLREWDYPYEETNSSKLVQSLSKGTLAFD